MEAINKRLDIDKEKFIEAKKVADYIIENEDDSYDNYVLDVVETGTLTIKQRQVELITYTGEKVYDGKVIDYTYTYEDSENEKGVAYTLINKVADEVDTIKEHTEFINVYYNELGEVSSKANVITLKIEEDGIDVTYNYHFNTDYGTLLIKRRDITIQADYAVKVYDNTELKTNEWVYLDSPYEVVEGETLTIVTTGSIVTKYKVYVYPITNGATVEFKKVTLAKA